MIVHTLKICTGKAGPYLSLVLSYIKEIYFELHIDFRMKLQFPIFRWWCSSLYIVWRLYILNLPIGQRPIALLDSSRSININSISTAATIYLMSTVPQNCKINCLYSVLPGKLEVIMLIALINWYKSYV